VVGLWYTKNLVRYGKVNTLAVTLLQGNCAVSQSLPPKCFSAVVKSAFQRRVQACNHLSRNEQWNLHVYAFHFLNCPCVYVTPSYDLCSYELQQLTCSDDTKFSWRHRGSLPPRPPRSYSCTIHRVPPRVAPAHRTKVQWQQFTV
jgi:hypothetical protein